MQLVLLDRSEHPGLPSCAHEYNNGDVDTRRVGGPETTQSSASEFRRTTREIYLEKTPEPSLFLSSDLSGSRVPAKSKPVGALQIGRITYVVWRVREKTHAHAVTCACVCPEKETRGSI